jgi:agmatinase
MTSPPFTPFGGDDVPYCRREAARVVVLPLCYENAVSYGTGTAAGPLHLLDASQQLEVLDEESGLRWDTVGIHTCRPMRFSREPEHAVEEMEAAAREVLDGNSFLLGLGGDHAVSIGLIRAASRAHPSLSVLQIDAHPDLRDRWNGSRFNHACVMRRVVEDMGLSVVQVGVRTLCPEEASFLKEHDVHTFFAHHIDPLDFSWVERAGAFLGDPVYITLDLDGLDPSVVPGTGTPEPGGLSFRQVVRLIAAVGASKTVVGADIVELSPIPGQQVSEYTAAKLAAKIIMHCVVLRSDVKKTVSSKQ